jgi:predicted nucleic acid-binding protein
LPFAAYRLDHRARVADLIVSGDADLLALNPFREIPIVTSAAFVQGAAR